ncbi:MAG TPA: Spy/CpxP family protein refolding chaperone [Ottowia sp.]|uniref:Spy/CpxP family protein refolding chaperone n=2 Tax=Ottowia sp. TaxID=1898956 RepID=UPI002C495ABF|nr:Spy/CpxP family protein refolding chaperone [Ottowia sp.]HRQ04256.1 Spy/CpxP family protein refolding chaperone [Ottowia sp.]
MKTWIKRTLIGVATAAIVLGGLSACSHRMHRGGWGGDVTPGQSAEWRGRMVERVAGKLDLNAEQKAKLNALANTMQAQRQALRGSTDPRAEMQSLVAGEKFDRAKAQALVQQKTEAMRSGSPEMIGALADFYDSLNPAQQQQVREFMAKRRGWRRG